MKVSVIVPVYNQSHYLVESIESILQNDFQNLEIVIVNDGSTDDTEIVSKELALKHSNIKIVSQENKGLSAARNAGFENSEGDIIHFLDSDDKVFLNAYSCIVDKFTSNKDIDILVSGYSYFKSDKFIHTHQFAEKEIYLENFLQSSIAPPASFFLRRRIVQEIGEFDRSLKSCEDWDYWIRAAKMGATIISIPEVLVAYRYVPDSMSRNAKLMYDSLIEVSQRACKVDFRISLDYPLNKEQQLDFVNIRKLQLIRVLGILIQQEKIEESILWFKSEYKKWSFNIKPTDWTLLSTHFTWRYFLSKTDCEIVMNKIEPNVQFFLSGIGYSDVESKKVSKNIFEPQLKKLNHFRFGKIIGACFNKLGFY